jgi:hypothetical protein
MSLKSILVAACTVVLSATAFADDAHHPEKAGEPAAANPAAQPAPGTMDMGKMNESMQRMQEQMKKIQAASDPKERQRLVEEHMKTMSEAMPMLRAMSGNAGMGEAQRMQMMEQCMGMMQTMEHQKALPSAPK